ncbi:MULTISPECIES: beta-ketoacyl synthase chain length factor [Thalassospira]|uniref:Beta-ketoacyl synthase chain length factor n=1 Tax=Thalassospira aquimaris TaxID=3037796 RepID=A0ABT6GGW7_9PROT|nr:MULTISPECIES: beta-ketoacyl synthase chain length factor [Thalassospira]MDG4720869.1 beta-ketoacyl synthase chain length factor [Thalassospira sp. FZY0004]
MTLLCARMPGWAFWEHTDGQSSLTIKRNADAQIATEISDPAKLAQSIKPAWRRRLDLFGRAAAEVLTHALDGADNPRIVFCSQHGNIERTVKLLHQVATDDALSPADFSMSVHNAFIGVASINWSITESHTAISAGNDSLVSALTETLAQLATDPRPVILCFVDLPLPEIYRDHVKQSDVGMALAIRFEAATDKNPGMEPVFTFADMTAEDRQKTSTATTTPFDQAKALVAFLTSPSTQINMTGKTTGWVLSRHD